MYNDIIANRPITTTSPKEQKFIRCFNTVKAMLGNGNFDFIDVLYAERNKMLYGMREMLEMESES